jgi:hypothetical protein
MFEVGIGTSQNWEPEKAAEEVITQALSKLTHPPKFVLLFSTIHYEKSNGFKKILDAVYEHIPTKTPLIGGTVAGFINNSGCYARGLTAVACYSDEIAVVAAVGHNTKRNPKKAAEEFLKMLQKEVQKKNKLCLFLAAGAEAKLFPF